MSKETKDKPKTVPEQLDDLFAPWNRSDAPGLAVGVAKNGQVIYRRGFGMASLETGVANHDAAAWAPHIADEFAMLSSANDHPLTKSDRIATLNLQKQSGRGSAPSPLVSAEMFDFGDSVIMTCMHQPYTGKPVHVSRLWIKRNGKWVMSISFQTTIQAASEKTS